LNIKKYFKFLKILPEVQIMRVVYNEFNLFLIQYLVWVPGYTL